MALPQLGLMILNTMSHNIKETTHMEGINEINARLKFIGKIQRDEKLSISGPSMHPNNWITTFKRTINGRDGRKETLRFLCSTVDSAFEIIELHKLSQKPSDQSMCQELFSDLKHAQTGIRNLMSTYETDTKFCCDLEVLIGSIIRRLENTGIKDDTPATPQRKGNIGKEPQNLSL